MSIMRTREVDLIAIGIDIGKNRVCDVRHVNVIRIRIGVGTGTSIRAAVTLALDFSLACARSAPSGRLERRAVDDRRQALRDLLKVELVLVLERRVHAGFRLLSGQGAMPRVRAQTTTTAAARDREQTAANHWLKERGRCRAADAAKRASEW
jgi:hypothetical protein